MKPNTWLNKNIFGMGLASFFSDFGHEMATAILPAFIVSIGGSAATLGLIEGFADASTSLGKVISGWYSDNLGKRKPFMNFGYLMTALGVGSLSVAISWPMVLISRVVAWTGRGTRESARDALLLDSSEERFHGRVFGFHRAMDTLGAIAGPLSAYFLIRFMPLRHIFVIAFIPSILSFLAVVLLVKEVKARKENRPGIRESLRLLPPQYRKYLIAIGIFGLGNFADSILILRATTLLSPVKGVIIAGSLAILLYTLHNVFYALLSYPIGILGDRFGRKRMLSLGFFITAVSSLGFIAATYNVVYLAFFFILAGIAMAFNDGLEDAVAGDLLPTNLRGTGYGALAGVNGVGDFVSSTTVGGLLTAVSPLAGFGYAAVLTAAGALLVIRVKTT